MFSVNRVNTEFDSSSTTNGDCEMVMRERWPNPANKTELLQMLGSTRSERRMWINTSNPSTSEIFRRYPRLQDMDEAVSTSIL